MQLRQSKSGPTIEGLDDAIARSVAALYRKQRADGAWNGDEVLEPMATATHLVCASFMGTLQESHRRSLARYLVSMQRADGGFPPNIAEARSDLSSTGLVIAALTAAGTEPQALGRARRFLDAQGGLPAVVERLYSRSDQTALYCAMAGLVSARALPTPHLSFLLLSPVVDFMQRRLNAGVIMGMISMSAITRSLLAREGERTPLWLRPLYAAEARAAIAYTLAWQNPVGSWNGNTAQTDLTAAGLFALGMRTSGDELGRARRWLDGMIADVPEVEGGQRIVAFTSEVWTTAFSVRALLEAGESRQDPRILRALEFMVAAQSTTPMPRADQRKPWAARAGGWAFQPDNPRMPDCDDTGTVLSALGLALDRDRGPPLPDEVQGRVQDAVDKGMAQLLDMQSPDGGWAGYVYGLPAKKPGPMFTTPMEMPRDLLGMLRMFVDPPVELGNPPVEGLTGRVLWGLGQCGLTPDSPILERAQAFLRYQQASNGGWWARWLVNYLSATSSVLGGLGACGVRPVAQYLKDAIDFIERHQNDDGGFGEEPASYRDPSLAGVGPSMAAVTGLVATGLILIGRRDTPTVERAVRHLVATQDDEGEWGGPLWMQVYMPPDGFYFYSGGNWFHPLEALALYRSPPRAPDEAALLEPLTHPPPFPAHPGREPSGAPARWPSSWLLELRHQGDPVADATLAEIYARGDAEAVRDVMATLVRSDEPLPTALPDEAKRYFTDTEALPRWADPALIARGQALFERHGWMTALGLFCSSLPQAYCAANGARVLMLSRGMTAHVRRRILETAQFVFDVCTPGALDGDGRGIRAAQKVRLMHATIRHLALLSERWDTEAWGVPVNQEDLAGTLMTFSVVVLDSMEYRPRCVA